MKTKPPKLFYRRNLSHYPPAGGIFFVTFRLENSIPLVELQLLEDKLLFAERKRYFKEYDALLDALKFGPIHLADPVVTGATREQLHRIDGHLYDLVAYCIMPNHVHLLIDTGI